MSSNNAPKSWESGEADGIGITLRDLNYHLFYNKPEYLWKHYSLETKIVIIYNQTFLSVTLFILYKS